MLNAEKATEVERSRRAVDLDESHCVTASFWIHVKDPRDALMLSPSCIGRNLVMLLDTLLGRVLNFGHLSKNPESTACPKGTSGIWPDSSSVRRQAE